MLRSSAAPLCPVVLPFMGRQKYMHGFDVANPTMPEGFEDYLAVVESLLSSAGITSGEAFMTVDEKALKAGETQRKPGPHVDGKFNRAALKWGGGGGWNHSCNILPVARTPVIVASSFQACRAWLGDFDATPNEHGGLEHIQDQLGSGVMLDANMGYYLSPDCIHESLPMPHDVERTFLRIALPANG